MLCSIGLPENITQVLERLDVANTGAFGRDAGRWPRNCPT